jgi:hypothetical protein
MLGRYTGALLMLGILATGAADFKDHVALLAALARGRHYQ